MKKKISFEKLSFEKSRISALNTSKIKGGSWIPTSLRQGGCVSLGCNVTDNPTGSECACE